MGGGRIVANDGNGTVEVIEGDCARAAIGAILIGCSGEIDAEGAEARVVSSSQVLVIVEIQLTEASSLRI